MTKWRWVLRGVLAVVGVGMIGGSALWAMWLNGPRSVELSGCFLVNDRELEVGWSSGAGLDAISMSMRHDDGVLVVDVREADAGGIRPLIGVDRTMRTTVDWFAGARPGAAMRIEDGKGRALTCGRVEQRSKPPQLIYPE